MSSVAKRATSASASTPSVCDTVTVSPSAAAWRAEPREPTRYAAMTVLPCPGETAWSAPRPAASRSEPMSASGVRSFVASSPAIWSWVPPGTAPAGTLAEPGSGVGTAATELGGRCGPDPDRGRARRRRGRAVVGWVTPGSGLASGGTNAGRAGPRTDTEGDPGRGRWRGDQRRRVVRQSTASEVDRQVRRRPSTIGG